jgi:hypothetical protein
LYVCYLSFAEVAILHHEFTHLLLCYDEEQLQTIICMHSRFLAHFYYYVYLLGKSNVLQTINGEWMLQSFAGIEIQSLKANVCASDHTRLDLAYLIDWEVSENRLLLIEQERTWYVRRHPLIAKNS